ncbi:MAG: hypothetical protein V9E81_16565 [Marmoricola sp.]
MPRSHSTMSGLPRWAMYSAAISHSSIVAVIPRLRSTGFIGLADGLQQTEVGHVAGADLQHVGVLRDDGDITSIHDFCDHWHAGGSASLCQNL